MSVHSFLEAAQYLYDSNFYDEAFCLVCAAPACKTGPMMKKNELKAQARENLTSELGLELRSLRPVEVESIFGNIKGSFGIRRFVLKGLNKVKLEWGLHCIAHNMRKMAASMG